MSKKFTLNSLGYSVELGKYAQQAAGAAWLQQGGTIVLATVVQSEAKDFPGFLPLTVDYREEFSAAGKIPGGYFKREGKWTDKEILTARLIDRAIRPLFPERYFNQVQIYILLLSYDGKHSPAPLASLATSIALSTSPVPFMGPIGTVEIARINGKFKVNPLHEERLQSDIKFLISGTKEGINMVEGAANQLSEKDLIEALFLGHEVIKEQVAWQEEIVKDLSVKKDAIELPFDWDAWQKRAADYLTEERVRSLCKKDKKERSEAMAALKEGFLQEYKAIIEEKEIPDNFIEYVLEQELKPKATDLIFADGKRIDGRSFTQVREISTSVGLLPDVHGSSLFQRGSTQALTSATLGSAQDEPRTELLIDEDSNKPFMLHYNFPPFSVGEVRPMRGPGRREVGHGNLAETALLPVLPDKNDFPYTIRILTDILSSDGSSSMATVCGSTMALMDAGVPISSMVSGVAMGLLMSSKGRFQVLTDLTGFEDAYGLMDFKVAGTKDGITAIQMDIKYRGGFPREVFEQALEQARQGRLHILDELQKVMKEPRPELSPLVPKIISIQINPDKIGAVIGGGGKVIKEIIDKTKTTIDIDESGRVNIFGGPEADIEKAINWVKVIAGQITAGEFFNGTVARIADFGIFVDLVPGQAGLLHISAIPKDKQRTIAKDYPIGSTLRVKVLDYDPETGRIRLGLADTEKKEHKK
ncbi:TPA: polyribonucleotide nucleotidyltransferase [Candidatus Dependentiae bacterium]|nr:MAG: Polyribonucleotide nucleotidyltransferase [candidate division TM6 bacterium GW2011_GWF2_36_131]KKQ02863.1 MAG: Polyribonucleotide nucleotidyltransferase [candidate division TM6 bacterium GW2011_GWE2_36_25]KKQ19516.1 MAG: Polyribonucleotide nucleotidyltransferase [candidate division TM6 bacterium GW2011_GWA2_36_9]HBR70229.1 polyribonucleotide nucleotidyltransferase [Candidatus Dependentiae bacterium]HCU00613.1 polyribonucleotide nucleotidyltransferase [Candidatus Dependentiae bacterium]